MRKYTVTIEGDFEKGDCWECPISYDTTDIYGDYTMRCPVVDCDDCPLEEVKQGEWIDNIVERLEAATESVYNEVKGDYFDYIKTADAIEIVKGSKDEGNIIQRTESRH